MSCMPAPHPAEFRQRGRAGPYRRQTGGRAGLGGPDLGVDAGQFLDEFAGELVAGLGDDADGCRCGAQQVAGLPAGEELLGPAGDQLEQVLVDTAEYHDAGSVRARPSSSRRSTNSRNATVMSSTCTSRRPGLRSRAMATLCASTGSVLRPCPVSNTRTRADSLAG